MKVEGNLRPDRSPALDRGMGEEDLGQYEVAGEIFGPSAGAGLYRREMLEEIGLFDEDFFMYMEPSFRTNGSISRHFRQNL